MSNQVDTEEMTAMLPQALRDYGWSVMELAQNSPCLHCGGSSQTFQLKRPDGARGMGIIDGFLSMHSDWEVEIRATRLWWGIELLEKTGAFPCKIGGEHQVWTWRVVENE